MFGEMDEAVNNMIDALENTKDEGNEMCAKHMIVEEDQQEYVLVVMTKKFYSQLTTLMSADPRSTP